MEMIKMRVYKKRKSGLIDEIKVLD